MPSLFRPAKLHADKGYDFKRCRAHLRQRGIIGRIARRGIESSERLGKNRWVVERTHSWFAGFGKLRIRFERRLDIHEALLKLDRKSTRLNSSHSQISYAVFCLKKKKKKRVKE